MTVAGLPLAGFVGAWAAIFDVFDGRLPTVLDQVPIQFIGPIEVANLLSWQGASMPSPPGWSWAAATALKVLVPMAAFLAVLHGCLPMRRRIENVCGYRPLRLSKESELQQIADSLTAQSLGPSVRVWVTACPGINAMALSGPISGNAIVLSEGLLSQLPGEMVYWVVAHEYAHVLHGDTRSGSLWLLGMRSVHLFDRWRAALLTTALRVLAVLPVLRLLLFPCLIVVGVMNRVARTGRWVGSKVFLLFDRWASRRMELAADRYAAFHVGARPGIELFRALNGDLESRHGGLFATHPSMRERIAKLEKLDAPSAGGAVSD